MELGQRVDGSKRILFFDGVNDAVVVSGFMDNFRKENVVPHDDYPNLTLDEIAEQVGKDKIITVYQDTPLHGEIYHYGNHGEFWELWGITRGYA